MTAHLRLVTDDRDPVLITIDQLTRAAEERHAWLSIAAAQIERWKAEDAANGQPWGEDAPNSTEGE